MVYLLAGPSDTAAIPATVEFVHRSRVERLLATQADLRAPLIQAAEELVRCFPADPVVVAVVEGEHANDDHLAIYPKTALDPAEARRRMLAADAALLEVWTPDIARRLCVALEYR
jgi:hypothetical protein